MADEDKEKAEKLAAAKKRFEQLKKEQQKKGKKGPSKKKDDKNTESKAEDSAPAEETTEAVAPAEDEAAEEQADDVATNDATQPSISAQSKKRSESFRQGTSTAVSPAAGDVSDLYHKQAARIEELEKENKEFRQQQEEGTSRLAKADDELESLREGSGNLAELKSKAQEAERLQSELASVQRQLSQAQQAAKSTNRKASGASPDVTEQLSRKTSTIESLEMEISNLRNQVTGLQTTALEHDASTKELEDRAKAAETATESVQQELDTLKVSMSFPSDETKAANEDPEALTKRITVLESDLRTANSSLDAAAKRATSLEQKIEALTKLHRDATSGSQAKEKELTELRAQLRRRDRPSHVRDASEFELGEEETETGALQARIRALEAENFDLRRGVWRDKRASMQPGMDDDGNLQQEMYEDVDLNGPYTPRDGRKGSAPRQGSTFQDVLTSGINAFTGRPREYTRGSASSPQARRQSLGLLSEDGDDFDPEAFRMAQEEEAKRRVERMKEIKRGLDRWKGWRLDIAEIRQGGIGGGRECGPVFEV